MRQKQMYIILCIGKFLSAYTIGVASNVWIYDWHCFNFHFPRWSLSFPRWFFSFPRWFFLLQNDGFLQQESLLSGDLTSRWNCALSAEDRSLSLPPAAYFFRWLLTYELAATLSIVTRSDQSGSNQTVLELLSHSSSDSDKKNLKSRRCPDINVASEWNLSKNCVFEFYTDFFYVV